MEGFIYAMTLDLNMGYYIIRLDLDPQKICTIVLPWGEMFISKITNRYHFFQEKMSSLTQKLTYIKVHINDLLVITKSAYKDNLEKL